MQQVLFSTYDLIHTLLYDLIIRYEGERNAMMGIFPTTYVEIIPDNEVSSLKYQRRMSPARSLTPGGTLSNAGTLREGKAKAKFNFQAQTPMELSLAKGNFILKMK